MVNYCGENPVIIPLRLQFNKVLPKTMRFKGKNGACDACGDGRKKKWRKERAVGEGILGNEDRSL